MRVHQIVLFCVATAAVLNASTIEAGPYSTVGANKNAGAIDAAIPGYVGPDGNGYTSGSNYVNPAFVGWATGWAEYDPFDLESIQEYFNGRFADPTSALGAAGADLVSLGDMSAADISNWRSDPTSYERPGSITLTFDRAIADGVGADFAVFENCAGMDYSVFAELAYVEVSTDGANWVRFPSVSLTENAVGGYGSINPTDVYNLAGKHLNMNKSQSWGTPFDLACLLNEENVQAGLVDLSEINYVKIVDVPGSGAFTDSLGNPIYDAWLTYGSGGFDLDAVGVLNQQVPEPATSVLGVISALSLGWYGFRRKSER